MFKNQLKRFRSFVGISPIAFSTGKEPLNFQALDRFPIEKVESSPKLDFFPIKIYHLNFFC